MNPRDSIEARLDSYRTELQNLPRTQLLRRTDLTARVSELSWVLRVFEGVDR